jgi:citrate lyase subunit beta/citryl-CoA lyase
MTSPAAGFARRSHLFAPGSNERLLAKVFDAGADAVVLDLEDAVAPDAKAAARDLVAAAVARRAGHSRPSVAVRINGVDTEWWRDDLRAVIRPGLDMIRVPKAESAEQLHDVDAFIRVLEAERQLAPGTVAIVATIESATGVMAAAEMARAPRMRSFAFGATDFVRDIGADPAHEDLATLYARQHLVLVSRAAGIDPPIASVHTQVKDLDALRRTTEEGRAVGFFGRSCIHPSQLPVVHEVFTPPAAQVAAARAITEAWARALARGSAAFTMPDGQFVDVAVARRAQAVVALAEALEEGLQNAGARG